jgi:hypothetical protein
MEDHMKHVLFAAILVSAFPAGAQTTNFNQVQHIQTALDHLTVVDLGEPVVDLAVADRDAFQIEQHDSKVFIMPLREGVATNLFIWTASRQLDYEIDPAGELARMNVLVRDLPQSVAHVASAAPTDQEIQKIATLVLNQTLIGTEEISHDEKLSTENQVHVELNQVFRSKSLIYVRYTITNSSKDPFRITPPDVFQPSPTQTPISLVSLRNHQLSDQTFAAFKVRLGSSLALTNAQSQVTDLAPGQKTTGILSIPGSPKNPPQLYQLQFGKSQSKPITVDAVL